MNPDDQERHNKHTFGVSWSNQDGTLTARQNPLPQPLKPYVNHRMISIYFSKLNYPPIKEVRLVLETKIGAVYLVSFDEKVLVGGSPQHPCYAIIKDGTCSGYAEDFWTDADKYKLVLKQHLGMLALEEVDNPKPEVETNPADPVKIVNPDTVEAIVGRYEGLVHELNKKIEDQQKELDALCKKAVDNLDIRRCAKEKLSEIKDILDGKKPPKHIEHIQSPEELAIDQAGADFLADDQSAIMVAGPDGLMYSPYGAKI